MSDADFLVRDEVPHVPGNPFLDLIARRVEEIVGGINFVVLATMTVVVFLGVVSRYVFNDAFSWTEELAIWGFTWLIFVGSALGIRGNRHVSVDFLAPRLSGQPRAIVLFLRDTLIALAVVALTFSGYELASRVGGVSITLQWPNALRYGVIPAAGLVALLFLLLARTDRRGLIRQACAIAAAGALYLLVRDHALSPFQDVSPSLLMAIVFFVTMALGVPVAFCMFLGAFLTTWSAGLLPAPALIQNMVAGSSKFILLAIPFFLTSAYLLNIGGLSARLIDFASALFGHLRGGLAQVNVFNSVLVGGISGSSGADAASDAKILIPEMTKRGYDPAFSCAVTSISSILPNILPPAIAMLVYASVTNVSVAQLFMAGVVPGLLIAAVLMVMAYIISRRRGYQGATKRAPLRVVGRTFLRALPALAIAIVVLGCIRFGITTATEAGVMALVWALVLGKFVFREYDWKELYSSLVECSVDAAMIGFLIASSVPFAWVLVAEGVPQTIVGWASEGGYGPFGLLVILNIVLFGAGMFLDLTPAMLIVAPLFLPLMTAAGIDPIHLGIIMIINLQLGGVTPPVGILVFISAQITKVAPYRVFREVTPFLIAVLATLAVICAFPILALGLWDLVGG